MTAPVVEFGLHANQEPIWHEFERGRRFFIVRCGRRFGKTEFCARLATKFGCEHAGSLIWWVSPYFALSKIGWRKMRKYIRGTGAWNRVIAHERKEPPPYFQLRNESEVYFLSAENEGQLIGEGVNLLVFDECARARPSAWSEAMAPTMIDDPHSRAVFISTPRGRNWLYDLEGQALESGALFIDRGKVVQEGDPKCPWAIFHYTSYDNPFHTREQIDTLLGTAQMPEEFIQQEIMAEYIGDMLEAFPGWRSCLGAKRQPAEPGHTYSIGFDVGHKRDFCVISVVDRRTLEEVHLTRFKDPAWTTQRMRLVDVAKLYPGKVVMESNGAGDPQVEELRQNGVAVEEFFSGSRAKSMMIKHFQVELGNHRLRLLDEPEANAEMAAFEVIYNDRTGVFAGQAPYGKHDDIVDARMMAYWGVGGGQIGRAVIPEQVRTSGERRMVYAETGGY